MMRWIGPAIALVAAGFAVAAAVVAIAIRDPSWLIGTVASLPVLVLDIALHVIGTMAGAAIGPDGIRWGRGASAREVLWEHVARVIVPMDPRREGRTVQLLLHDGIVVPVTALSMSSSENRSLSTGSRYSPDPGYQRAGDRVIAAHSDWLLRNGRAHG